MSEQALVERKAAGPSALSNLTRDNVKTMAEFTERVRQIQDAAFVLSPMNAAGDFAPQFQATPVIVWIDPTIDPKSGRGADVYHQYSIHKSHKVGDDWVADEVSVNHNGLMRILNAAGVNVKPTRWLQDGVVERNIWVCETDGEITDFTGTVRSVPTGIGSLDARDGSPDIGEWSQDEWAKRVAAAEAKKASTKNDNDRKRIKPEAINGWTAERVMQVRKYGRQLAKTKSLNGLARKLGVRQSYTIDELKRKPFVIMRAVYVPDMSNPEVAKMYAAAHLGVTHLLYGGPSAPKLPPPIDEPITHAHGEEGSTIAGEVVHDDDPPTAAAPTDAEELPDDPEPAAATPAGFVVTRVLRRKLPDESSQYFVETTSPDGAAGPTLFTTDVAVVKACQAAAKDKQPREFTTERIGAAGQTYLQIVDMNVIAKL